MTAHSAFLFASLKFGKTKEATKLQHTHNYTHTPLAVPNFSARDVVQTNALTCTHAHMHTNAHTNTLARLRPLNNTDSYFGSKLSKPNSGIVSS